MYLPRTARGYTCAGGGADSGQPLHLGRIRAFGAPGALTAELGLQATPGLEAIFHAVTGEAQP